MVCEIYKIFNTREFPHKYEDVEAYHNIKKSSIYVIAARPMLFLYNDVARWCFTHIENDIYTIMNKSRIQIESLKP
jgi:hypothetical protein